MNSSDWVCRLLDWYEKNKRPLPWRSKQEPYGTWVSEIMLQQTQVRTVIPYFDRFMCEFPTIQQLAEANIQEVLKIWEGLGYYSRVRNLHRAASVIVNEFKGELPATYKELRSLPGMGEYTAAAVASIAFSEAVPALDGNALRVFARFWGITDIVYKSNVRKMIWSRLLPIIETTNPSHFNQSVMELGALICRPRNPQCDICPVGNFCVAKERNLTSQLPVRARSRPTPRYTYGAGVIWSNETVLIQRRNYNVMLGGLWEFPGGKLITTNSFENALSQKIYEQTALQVRVLKYYCEMKHAYSHFKIVLHTYKCELATCNAGRPNRTAMTDDLRWVNLTELSNFPFDKATLKVIDLVRQIERK